jgi:hypothetical protein
MAICVACLVVLLAATVTALIVVLTTSETNTTNVCNPSSLLALQALPAILDTKAATQAGNRSPLEVPGCVAHPGSPTPHLDVAKCVLDSYPLTDGYVW